MHTIKRTYIRLYQAITEAQTISRLIVRHGQETNNNMAQKNMHGLYWSYCECVKSITCLGRVFSGINERCVSASTTCLCLSKLV